MLCLNYSIREFLRLMRVISFPNNLRSSSIATISAHINILKTLFHLELATNPANKGVTAEPILPIPSTAIVTVVSALELPSKEL